LGERLWEILRGCVSAGVGGLAGAAAADEVLYIVGLRGVKLLGDANGKENAGRRRSRQCQRRGSDSIDAWRCEVFSSAGNDGDAAGTSLASSWGVDIFFPLANFVVGRERAGARRNAEVISLPTREAGWGREFLGEVGLEDGFFGGRRRKVLAGDGVEGAGGAGRFGERRER